MDRFAVEQYPAALYFDGADTDLEGIVVGSSCDGQVIKKRVFVRPQAGRRHYQAGFGYALFKGDLGLDQVFPTAQAYAALARYRLLQPGLYGHGAGVAGNPGDNRNI